MTIKGMRAWTDEQIRVMTWDAEPSDHMPSSLAALAREMGIIERTIRRRRTLPGWSDCVRDIATGKMAKHVPKLLDSALQHALAGNYRYWECLMRMAGVELEVMDKGTEIRVVFNDKVVESGDSGEVRNDGDGSGDNMGITANGFSVSNLLT